MIPERLNFLSKFQGFISLLTNAVKENKIDEKDFFVLLSAKCKSRIKEIHYQKKVN